ncbi:MAG: hypothetical protein GY780_02245 [bacterium]|nr:hypothetical protein [bacterium]
MIKKSLIWTLVLVITFALVFSTWETRLLWPPLAAVMIILATRNALAGLLAGGFAGAILLTNGHPFHAAVSLIADHLAPCAYRLIRPH